MSSSKRQLEDTGKRSPSKQRRTKTFVGCFTCRRRKVACDLGKPSCERCKKSGFVCDGYKINLRWSQPVQYDKYGTQLPLKPVQETEYCQRRSIKFVKYTNKTAYKLYDEMNKDLARLHNKSIADLSSPTEIRGHFGVFRGILRGGHRIKARQEKSLVTSTSSATSLSADLQNKSNSASNLPSNGFSSTSINNGNEWLSNELLDAALLTASALNGDTHWLDMFENNADIENKLVNSNHLQPDNQHDHNGKQNSNEKVLDSSNDLVPDQMLHMLFQGRQPYHPGNTNDIHYQLFKSTNAPSKPQQPKLSQKSISNTSLPKSHQKESHSKIQEFQHLQDHAQRLSEISPEELDADTPELEENSEIDSPASRLVPIKNENNKFKLKNQSITRNDIQIHANETTRMPKSIMDILENPPLPITLAIDNFGIPTTSLAVHPMARYLLNYYIEDVADMMTVIPLAKNPWKFIYFPRAIMAIGELASLGKTSNARQGLLNALLAVSAFNLQSKFVRGSDEMKYYVDLGIQLRKQASFFVSKCLEEDILSQKYKDVLVAVLSMVTIDVVWGTMSGCKIHLDYCEKIIEKKMLHKTKLSSKAIILHRIFSSLKLLQDSTSLENIQANEMFLNERNYKSFLIGAKATDEQLQELATSNIRGIFKGNKNIMDSRSNSKAKDDDSPSADSVNGSEFKKKGKYSEKITDNGKVRIEYVISTANTESSVDCNAEIPAFVDITRTSFQPSKNKLDDKVVSSDAIYGLPNSLILLFGEIVPLSRFKKYHDDHNLAIPKFFEELASQLEYKLLTWKMEWTLTTEEEEEEDEEEEEEEEKENENEEVEEEEKEKEDAKKKQNQKEYQHHHETPSQEGSGPFISPRHEGIYHHVMSFYHALVIYFYRFVEEVNPIYLQERVEKVLFHLNKIQEILKLHKESSYIIPLFWQGFIAGSEAMTLYLQNGFNKWGQDIAQTGIGTYWNARQIMLEIWRRKNHNIQNNNWTDVLKDWKTNIMLV